MHANDIALIGLAVMGQNLALNMARNGQTVTVYNRTWEKTETFLAGPALGSGIIGARDVLACVASLKKPRRIFLMVKAGQAVDDLLDSLAPLLEPGDMVMDGGNSHFEDTEARLQRMAIRDIDYLGVGVSGGEHGALLGPSIMAGGPIRAWKQCAPLLKAIAAKAEDGSACAGYMGGGGAGHFVKMVHNGIEYAVMQLLSELHDLLLRGLHVCPEDQQTLFSAWNSGPAASYLLDITAEILGTQDLNTGAPLLDSIRDKAGAKGTGVWTSQSALTLGVAVPTITAAVDARMMSGLWAQRQQAAAVLSGPAADAPPFHPQQLGQALHSATLMAYAQGFALLQAAEFAWNWGLAPAEIARVWRAGCIIRANFLDTLARAFEQSPPLPHLLLADSLRQPLTMGQDSLRATVRLAAGLGIPTPALSASLAYYDTLRSARLPANLLQAQRDYFGAHGFERLDQPGTFHGPWEKSQR
jgi:6-phosphogluconate dehydrogenase